MDKAQGLCVKGLAREELEAVLYELTVLCVYGSLADFRAVITLVIEERMADPVEVDTDLVGASCLQTALHDSNIAESFKHLVMSDSVLSVVSFREHLEAHPVVRVAADVADDGALVFFQITPDDCDIAALDGVHEELLCKMQLGLFILGHDQKA